MAERLYVVDEDRDVRWRQLVGEGECRPGVRNTFNERHVSLSVNGGVSEVRNRRLFAGQAVKLVCNVRRHVRSHGPCAVVVSSDEAEQSTGAWLGLTRSEDAAVAVEQEQRP